MAVSDVGWAKLTTSAAGDDRTKALTNYRWARWNRRGRSILVMNLRIFMPECRRAAMCQCRRVCLPLGWLQCMGKARFPRDTQAMKDHSSGCGCVGLWSHDWNWALYQLGIWTLTFASLKAHHDTCVILPTSLNAFPAVLLADHICVIRPGRKC